MNYYKLHFNIQSTITTIAAFLAITIFSLVIVTYLQAIMGVYQTIIAIVLFANYKDYPSAIQQQLKTYARVWIFNLLLMIAIFTTISYEPSSELFELILFLFFVIPWASIIYFLSIQRNIYLWKDELLAKQEIENDQILLQAVKKISNL